MVDGTITSWSPCFQPKNSFYGKNELNLRWMICSTHSIKILTSYKIRQLAFRKKMGLLTILKKLREEEREMRILMLGLDGAGKTTVVRKLLHKDVNVIEVSYS